jgi:hypothetical protein
MGALAYMSVHGNPEVRKEKPNFKHGGKPNE